MDGITALDLWDLVVEVLHSSKNPLQYWETCGETKPRKTTPTPKTKKHLKRHDVEFFNVDHVVTNANSS